MKISPFAKFRNTIGDIKRFQTVVTVLFEEGFAFAVDEMKLRDLVPLRARFLFGLRHHIRKVGANKKEIPPEVRLRRILERLGPTFMKLGQLLSTRPDIMPPEFIAELAKLQDKGPILNPGVAEKIVEDELKTSIENVFIDFEMEPIAAASLAQVHRATLRDGTKVAVKVRRPGIEDVIKTDIHILTYLSQLIEKHIEVSRKYKPIKIVREFAEWTLREIDFGLEGAHNDLFRESFADMPEIVIPKVYWEHTTKRVLVADLLEGIKIDNLEELDKHNVDRHQLAVIGLKSGVRMFLLNGFFHADPHPGNLVVMPPEFDEDCNELKPLRVGMFDFGMVGRISDRYRHELIGCFMSFVERDVDSYIKHVLDIAEFEEDADVRSFESQTHSILTGVLHKPNEKKGLARAFYKVVVAGAQYGVMFPSDMVLLAKAFLTVEKNGFRLYPDIDLAEELRPFLSDIVRAEIDPRRLIKDLKTSAFDALYFARRLPEQTQALLDRLDSGEIGVKLNLKELRDLKAEFDRQNDVRVLALLAAALLLASGAVLRLDVHAAAFGISLGKMGFVASIIIVLWLFWLIRKKP